MNFLFMVLLPAVVEALVALHTGSSQAMAAWLRIHADVKVRGCRPVVHVGVRVYRGGRSAKATGEGVWARVSPPPRCTGQSFRHTRGQRRAANRPCSASRRRWR